MGQKRILAGTVFSPWILLNSVLFCKKLTNYEFEPGEGWTGKDSFQLPYLRPSGIQKALHMTWSELGGALDYTECLLLSENKTMNHMLFCMLSFSLDCHLILPFHVKFWWEWKVILLGTLWVILVWEAILKLFF